MAQCLFGMPCVANRLKIRGNEATDAASCLAANAGNFENSYINV